MRLVATTDFGIEPHSKKRLISIHLMAPIRVRFAKISRNDELVNPSIDLHKIEEKVQALQHSKTKYFAVVQKTFLFFATLDGKPL